MPRQVRYSRCLAISGLFALIFILASCQSGCGSSNSTKKPSQPTAQQLIRQAQDAIQQVKSYHFNLTATHLGEPKAYPTFLITTAEGDIQIPDKLQAKADVIALGTTILTKIIAISNQQYYTTSFTPGTWTQTTNLLDPRRITNSRTGVAGILGHIEHPTPPVNSNVGGTSCWNINGNLDARYLSVITAQATQPGNILNTTVCIGKSDNLPYLFRMQGIALHGDTVQTVRTFVLSHFNEPLSITPPQMQ